MQRCLQLAHYGEGRVAPNPMVGAVLVHKDKIIGEGFHKKWGEAHAEVVCLQSVKAEQQHLIHESTLYVSLEPCSHYGKTPPCADLIIQHRIPRVVVGCADPYGEVSGRGINKLKRAGIEVMVGVLERECRALNKRFVLFQEGRRPYIILKWAQSADGKIAGENFKRMAISNEYTARLVHRWRSQNMGILVGTNTALADDPELTTRFWPGNNPVRLVLDKTLCLPLSLKLFDGQHKTIVFNNTTNKTHSNVEYDQLNFDGPIVPQIVEALYNLNIQSVMVEGGAQMLQSFIDAEMWDEAYVITNQHLSIGKGIPAPHLKEHRLLNTQPIFSDTIHSYAHQSNALLVE